MFDTHYSWLNYELRIEGLVQNIVTPSLVQGGHLMQIEGNAESSL